MSRLWSATNGKKTLAGLVMMGLAYAGLRTQLATFEQAQALFLAGLGLASVGAGHKVAKRRRRKASPE